MDAFLRRHMLTCLGVDLMIADRCEPDIARELIASRDYFERARRSWCST